MNGKIQSFVVRGFALLLGFLAAILVIKYVLPIVLPFLIGYFLSSAVRPFSSFLEGKTKITKKVWAPVIIVGGAGVLGFVLWLVCATVVKEAVELVRGAGELMSDPDSALRAISDKVMETARRFDVKGEGLDLTKLAGGAVSALATGAAKLLQGAASHFPSCLLFCAVTVLSLFYFSCDIENIREQIKVFVPPRVMNAAGRWWNIILRSVKRFLRAYFVLFLINWAVLSGGLLFIGTEYPFLAALFCAVVDILPVFGMGTVLVPWSLVMFLTGDTGRGVELLVLLCVMYALRQVLEARLVGKAAGVHPVLALFSVFLGFKLLGIGGVITAPLLLNGASILWEEKGKKVE